MCEINIPVGISDFEKIRQDNYYFLRTICGAFCILPVFVLMICLLPFQTDYLHS